MSKPLLCNEQEYEKLKSSCEVGRLRWWLSKPESYPCICMFERRDNNNGADYYDGDYIYIEDFEGLAVWRDNTDDGDAQ